MLQHFLKIFFHSMSHCLNGQENQVEICFIVFPVGNQHGFHMRYHLLLYYKWFLQNLGKDFFRTNMHTTVPNLWSWDPTTAFAKLVKLHLKVERNITRVSHYSSLFVQKYPISTQKSFVKSFSKSYTNQLKTLKMEHVFKTF